LRFYIFYMLVVAIGSTLVVGTRTFSAQSLVRQLSIIMVLGLAFVYLAMAHTSSAQLENFANLETIQKSREVQSRLAQTGYAEDVDVSTASGALSALPKGLSYLLFAPFPWQMLSVRQMITLPEMIIWWTSFPLLVLGLWFALKYKLRQVLPIIIFTSMLTFAYAVAQGNVGTAYRQRSQLLIFYFIFVAAGLVLFREVREDQRRRTQNARVPVMARHAETKI